MKQIEFRFLSVNKIKPNPYQPRQEFSQNEIDKLASSIKQKGVIEPLIVTYKDNQYYLIAGERRLIAAKQANLTEVPAIIVEISNQEMLEIALIENEHRKELNPIERALAIQKLIEEFNMQLKDVAILLGVSKSKISNTLRLLKLPKEVQDMLKRNEITEGHAKILVNLPENEAIKLAILFKDKTVRELENYLKRLKSKNKEKFSRENLEINEEIRGIFSNLKKNFNFSYNVNLKEKKLNLKFKSQEEFFKFIENLNKINNE